MKFLKNKIKIITLLVIVIILVLGTFYFLNKKESTIPTLKITLKDTALNEINNNSKEIKYENNSLIIDDTKYDNITIKGRGNTTWNWPKKPYQIEFSDKEEILNLGKSKKYILLANYVDETLLRTDIAFYIANKLDMKYSPKGTWVNLYIDSEYLGVYYLTNKIEIGEGSVDLKDDLGLIVELDNSYYYEEQYYKSNIYKDHLVVKDVKNKDKKEDTINLFLDKYNQLEEAVSNYDWNKIKDIIDIKALAKYEIVNALTHNSDYYKSSFFMYMDGSNDKIHFGPIWDFDRSFDNKVSEKVDNSYTIVSDDLKDETYGRSSEMITKLITFKEFKSIVKEEWNKYMNNGLEDIENKLNKEVKVLKKDAVKNIELWNYPNTYQEYIESLKTSITKLYNRLEERIKNG